MEIGTERTTKIYKVATSHKLHIRVSIIPFKNALEMELMFATCQLEKKKS